MANPVSSPEDVTNRIDTGLDDPEIQTLLSDAVFDMAQVYSNLEEKDEAWRMQVEWRLAAYKIMVTLEPETIVERRESVRFDYAESALGNIRKEIRNLTDNKLPLGKEDIQGSYEVL